MIWRRALLVSAIGAAGAAAFASPARAEGPVDQGWWTSTTPAGLPIGAVTPPDVPAQGLLVQGGPGATTGPGDTGATAYAALVFGVAPGATVGHLTLTAAPGSLSTPAAVLEVCALTDSAFSSVQGGPISAAPPYDCSHDVTATESSTSTFAFSVADLVSGSQLAVAVLPTSPLERVVLVAPGEGTLETTAASSAGLTGVTTVPTTLGSVPAAVPEPATTALPTAPASVSAVGSTSPAPAPAVSPAVAPLPASSTTAAPSGTSGVPGAATAIVGSTTESSGANPAAAIVAAGLVVLGALAWRSAGRQSSTGPTGGPAGDPEPSG